MTAFLQMDAMGDLSAQAVSGLEVIAQSGIGDWGELLVFALVVVVSGANGLIQAAKKKREAKERERQMPLSRSSSTPPEAKPARARPRPVKQRTAQASHPIPLPAKPLPPRTSPVSKSPPTANVPPIFETLAEGIRDANKEQSPRRSKRRAAAREVARPVAAVGKPPKKAHQAVSDRHFIQKHEREHEESMERRLGHVAAGLLVPTVDPYANKTVKTQWLRGVDLRQAMILKEILGPPVAMRDTDDYFSP